MSASQPTELLRRGCFLERVVHLLSGRLGGLSHSRKAAWLHLGGVVAGAARRPLGATQGALFLSPTTSLVAYLYRSCYGCF